MNEKRLLQWCVGVFTVAIFGGVGACGLALNGRSAERCSQMPHTGAIPLVDQLSLLVCGPGWLTVAGGGGALLGLACGAWLVALVDRHSPEPRRWRLAAVVSAVALEIAGAAVALVAAWDLQPS